MPRIVNTTKHNLNIGKLTIPPGMSDVEESVALDPRFESFVDLGAVDIVIAPATISERVERRADPIEFAPEIESERETLEEIPTPKRRGRPRKS